MAESLSINNTTRQIARADILNTSECAGDCRLSANLCKRALDVIVEATCNAKYRNYKCK